ncbi:MAG: YtxH domain-containing protein [Candidatus Obscuribacterales bacterium]|nr:YtxH domain-containing protein [Candidatus Obscuribacterales bacterium]
MKRFILAGLFGYVVGILCAPKKGSELRSEIQAKLLDLQSRGSDALEAIQHKGQILVETAAPAVEQVQIEGSALKQESEEIAKNAAQLFNESYERGASALEQAEQRIKEKAAPVVSLVKEDAIALKNQGEELLKKASDAFKDRGAKEIDNNHDEDRSDKLYKNASNM